MNIDLVVVIVVLVDAADVVRFCRSMRLNMWGYVDFCRNALLVSAALLFDSLVFQFKM